MTAAVAPLVGRAARDSPPRQPPPGCLMGHQTSVYSDPAVLAAIRSTLPVPAAEPNDCPHGYRITDSCPGCDYDAETAAHRTPSTVVKRHAAKPLPLPLRALDEIRALMAAHPELTSEIVYLGSDASQISLQVHGTDLRAASTALLSWAYRLQRVAITIDDYPDNDSTNVNVRGVIGDTEIKVFGGFYRERRAAFAGRVPSVHLLRDLAVNGRVTA